MNRLNNKELEKRIIAIQKYKQTEYTEEILNCLLEIKASRQLLKEAEFLIEEAGLIPDGTNEDWIKRYKRLSGDVI